MIPYQELCDALARWRTKNGLPNGPSARVRFQPVATVVSAPPSAAADPYFADEVGFGEPPTSVAVQAAPAVAPMVMPAPMAAPAPAPVPAPAPAPVALAAASPETYDGSVDEMLADDTSGEPADLDMPTSLHVVGGARKPSEETGEIDLDSDLVDEDDL